MSKVYLNDIDIDIFTKYFNSTNYTDTKNQLIYKNLTVSGDKYLFPINYKHDNLSEAVDLYTVDNISNTSGVNVSGLDTENVYVIPIINGFITEEGISKSITIEKEKILESIITEKEKIFDVEELLSLLNPSYELKKIHNVYKSSVGSVEKLSTDLFSYNIILKITETSVKFTLDDKITATNLDERLFTDSDIIEKVNSSEAIDAYDDPKNGNSVRTIDTFRSENAIYLILISNGSSSKILYEKYSSFIILIHPYIYKIPMMDKDGNYIYEDSNHKKTLLPEYPNQFYKHQKALRKSFFGLVENSGWQYKTPEKKIVLIKKGDNYQFAYYYNVNKLTTYSYISSDNLPEDVIFDNNIPSKEICDSPENYGNTETVKELVYSENIMNFPLFRTYIKRPTANSKSIEDESFKFSYIKGLNDKNFDLYKNKPIILEIYTRTTSLSGSETLYDVSDNETINIMTSIGAAPRINGSYNEYTLCNIDGGSPYILLPLVTDKKTALSGESILSLNGQRIYIGDSIGKIGSNSNPKNVASMYLDLNGEKLKIYSAKELGFNYNEILTGLNCNYETEDIFFFKIPFTKVNSSMLYKVICTLNDYSPAESSNSISLTPVKSTNLYDSFISPFKMIGSPIGSIIKTVTSPYSGVLKNTGTLKKVPINSTSTTSAGIPSLILSNSRNFNIGKSLMSPLSLKAEDADVELLNYKYSAASTQAFIYEYNYPEKIETIYYKNPYSTDLEKLYIKKEITYQGTSGSVQEEFGKFIYLESSESRFKIINNINNLVTHFSKTDRYFSDNMIKLRGDLVTDNVFYNNRKAAIKNSISDILKNENCQIIDIENELLNSDGYDRFYNYCKSVVNFIKFGYERSIATINYNKNTIGIDDFSKKMILQEITYPEKTPELTTDFITGALSKNRSFIEKISEREKFPLDSIYDKYISEVTKIGNIIDSTELNKIENVNLKYYTKDMLYSSHIISGDAERILIGDAITNFIFNGTGLSLRFDIPESILKNNTPVYDIEEANNDQSYKKIYLWETLNDAEIDKIINDLTILKDNSKIMEVLDVTI